jgi:hypothetical protein
VNVAKIASVTAVNGNFISPDGFKQTGGNVSGTDITAKITSVTGTDSLGMTIALAAADYSVDNITGAAAGQNTSATVRVPVAKTSAGADITKTFAVYIKNDAEAITAFYFIVDSKYYGAGTPEGITLESGSGTISGNTASIGNGGGVYVAGSASSFTMNGGTIGGTDPTKKNTAGTNGGGVHVISGGIFDMNGETISDNTANQGGGVYVKTGTFTMRSMGSIFDDNDCAIPPGKVLYNEGGTVRYGNNNPIVSPGYGIDTALTGHD